ncbi:MAG TPA: HAD family hydrolase [Janthinobacterium sp.]|jgi:phosphoglycolate phosphatase-like HAD superfamily hydrolase|nr:HAD family hydrolase [Janthinobacterium sp.]
MKPIICLDGDGVLLDFHLAYRHAWHKAFGVLPDIKDPQAYWPIDRWDVRKLESDELDHFRAYFDHGFWASVPAIPGALEACNKLADAGYELVCVTALDTEFQNARLENLRDGGFPIERVVTTGSMNGQASPKAEALRQLRPVAFVDDYLPYMRAIPSDIHAALILREPNGSPNFEDEQTPVHSRHADLFEFAGWWLEGNHASKFG